MGSRSGGTGSLAHAVGQRTWRGLLGISVLLGLGGGVVLGTFATARRTSTAHGRLIDATDAFDVLVNPDSGTESALDPEAVRRLPEVADLARADGIALVDAGSGLPLPITLVSDGVAYERLGRPNVLSGRLPDPGAGDEVFADAEWARNNGITVGDELSVAAIGASEFGLVESIGFDDAAAMRAAAEDGRLGPITTLRVVGIGVTIDSVVRNEGDDPGVVWLTAAFPALDGSTVEDLAYYYGLGVRLRSPEDLAAFRHAVDGMVPDESIAYRTLAGARDQVERTVRPVVISLTIVAVAGAALLLALVVVVMSRVVARVRVEQWQWWVLGAVRRERMLAVGTSLTLAVAAGTGLAVLVAWLLSPIGPVGPARVAEPDPGLRLEVRVVLAGAAALALVGVGLAVLVAWRSTRIEARTTLRASRTVERAAAMGLPATLVVGLRNALAGPGAVVAAMVAVAVGAAVITFASGVQRFTRSPALFGWNWDTIVTVSGPEEGAGQLDAVADALRSSDATANAAMVTLSDVALDGQVVVTAAFEPVKGELVPTVAAGRLPREAVEVALGARTMRSLGVAVGDTVTTADGSQLHVVGRVVLPGLANYSGADKTAVGEGAVVSPETLRALGPAFVPIGFAVELARWATIADLQADRPDLGANVLIDAQPVSRPSDVIQLGDLSTVPFLLAAVLALLALVVAVHAVWTAVQRRRREHAVLRALGWRPRDSEASVLWHATVIMVLAIAVGLPLGLVVGRWVWSRLAWYLGTVSVSVAPVATLVTVALAFGLVAVTGAVVPALRAGRQRPAVVLRAE